MGRYVRVLAESDRNAPLAELRTVLGPEFELVVEEGDEQDWQQLLLRHPDGAEIALVERDRVEAGEWGEQEIAELGREIESAEPHAAVEWLRSYFPKVKVIYSIQPLSGTEVGDGWSSVYRAQAYFWKKFAGILQADNEGFSNREGQHILWQFIGTPTGELEVAVLDDAGKWNPYTIEMSDPQQVKMFQRGEIPKRAEG